MNKNTRTRNNQFALRLSDRELALYNIKQSQSGLNKTDFLIEMLKDATIKVYSFNDSINALYSELRKIGVNLNQVTATANSGYFPEAERYIYQMQSQYSDVMEKLKSFLENPSIESKQIKVEVI